MLDRAKIDAEKDKIGLEYLNEHEQLAELQQDENKNKIRVKLVQKERKKHKNYGELIDASKKLAQNVDSLREVVYQTDEDACIDYLDLAQMRDLMLGGN